MQTPIRRRGGSHDRRRPTAGPAGPRSRRFSSAAAVVADIALAALGAALIVFFGDLALDLIVAILVLVAAVAAVATRPVQVVPRWTARTLNMSSLPFRELFDLDEARRRNEQAAELGAQAGFAMAEIQSEIDQVFLDLLEYEPGRAHSRMPRLIEQADASKGWHQWLMRGRLAEAAAEIALAKGDAEAAATAAYRAIKEATAVSRRKYETAARLVLGRALLQMKMHDTAEAELRAALAGAERLTHPPTLWRAWWSLSEALARTGDDRGAEETYVNAVGTLQAFAGRLAHERALLGAGPVTEILNSA